MIRKHVVISGRVQGVFFRDSCRRAAADQRIAGWVRKLPDGSVEAVFEGAPDRVERLVRWAHRGPDGASVAHVRVHDEPAEGLSEFQILPSPGR